MNEVPERWTAKARCRSLDPEIFFPTDGLGVQRAAAICAQCPVAEACLEYAMRNHIPHGVFGGLSERARARLRRSRAAAARSSSSSTTTNRR
jgi:WhiB family redox-sensing transcriptional regulator